MTYTRKTKRQPISPELEHWFATTGEQLLSAFQQRYLNGQKSMRGRNYDTQPDHSFHSAEQRTFHDRMEDRV